MVSRFLARFTALCVAALILALSATPADAKKVPIPCTGDRFIPIDAPAFNKTFGGGGLHLSYRFSGCSAVGYAIYDGNSRYKDLPADVIGAAEAMDGTLAKPGLFSALFKAPTHFWVEWLYLVVIGAIVVSMSRQKSAGTVAEPVAQRVETAPTAVAPTPAATRSASPRPGRTATAPVARTFGKANAARPIAAQRLAMASGRKPA